MRQSPLREHSRILGMGAFRPDVIVSVHAPHNVLDFDGPPAGMKAPLRFGRLRQRELERRGEDPELRAHLVAGAPRQARPPVCSQSRQ